MLKFSIQCTADTGLKTLLLLTADKKVRLSTWTQIPFSASVSNKLQTLNFMIQNHWIDQL